MQGNDGKVGRQQLCADKANMQAIGEWVMMAK
jgi:hypothetical protein